MGSNEKAKLKALLNYWVEHNREHSQEFKEWVDKAKALGEKEVAEELSLASQEMDKVSEILSKTLKRLQEA
jgi:nickel/cobalt exporter